jgi:prepilin-type N-terminal cleavage/methylation domain-containing protein
MRFMSLRSRFTAARDARQRGFTLPEVLSAMAIAMVVGATVTTVVMSTLSMMADTELTATGNRKTQQALEAFAHVARDAAQVEIATPNQLRVLYRTKDACQMQDFQILVDQNDGSRLRIDQSVASITLDPGVSCASVAQAFLGGQVSIGASKTILKDLGSGTRFTYYGPTGQQIAVPGDEGYNNDEYTPECLLASVSLTVESRVVTGNNSNDSNIEKSLVAFRNNQRGLGCSA